MLCNDRALEQSCPQFNGVVALNKPPGPSSAQCLRPFKRQGQNKIGHAGTLDPLATGVLIVLLGHATKLSSWILGSGQKIYSGAVRLGIETDSWDLQGQVVAEKSVSGIVENRVIEALEEWVKIREQEVPAYSAAKYHGQPLYKLARKGHDIPAKRKSVNIISAKVLEIDMPFVRFRVECSSGSYIRSLAHSLGVRLGCGAALAELKREYSYPYSLSDCVTLDEIAAGLKQDHVLPLNSALPDWPCVELNEIEAKRVCNGMPVRAHGSAISAMAFLCKTGNPVAIASLQKDKDGKWWRIERGLGN